jgi:peptide/nickel transport system permease protein
MRGRVIPHRLAARTLLGIAGATGLGAVALMALLSELGIAAVPALGPWLGAELLVGLGSGARHALLLGGSAAFLGLLVGLPLGASAGLRPGGSADRVVSFATQLHALPAVFLYALLLRWQGPPAFWSLCLVVSFGQALENARSLRERLRSRVREGYVLAAYGLGAPPGFVVRRHLLPHLWTSGLERFALGLSTAALLDASLAFMGLAPPDAPASWGSLIARGMGPPLSLGLVVLPSVLLLWTVSCALLLAAAVRDGRNERVSGPRDVLDPYESQRESTQSRSEPGVPSASEPR